MLILLPPSETKSPASAGAAPLDLSLLSFPELASARSRVLDRLVRVSGQRNALALLGVGAGLADQVAANLRLRTAPAQRVGDLYTGVLYDALDLPGLTATALRRAERSVVVLSALFGAVRLNDAIPPYRLSMDVALPRLGPLTAVWRRVLGEPLRGAAAGGVVVDCRSSTYAAAWRPPVDVASRTVAVRVLVERDGRRTVVSHMAKHARGVLARLLVQAPSTPRTPEEVATIAATAFTTELVAPGRPGDGWRLDLIERAPA